MNFLDLAAFVFASSAVMIVFALKTNLDQSRVRVKANRVKK